MESAEVQRIRVLGQGAIAAQLGVSRQTFSAWVKKYGPGTYHQDRQELMPDPAVQISHAGIADTYAWSAEQLPAIRTWFSYMYSVGLLRADAD